MTPVYFDRVSLAVRHAAHQERTRYAMDGVLVGAEGLTATDGRIMAHVTRKQQAGEERIPDIVLSLPTVKAVLKGVLSTGVACLNDQLTTCIAGSPAVEAKGRRKAKAAIPDKITCIPVDTVAGAFPPRQEVMSRGDHLEPIETTIDSLETIGDILGAHSVARLVYDGEGIILAEAKPRDEDGALRGEYTATVRFARLPARDGEEHVAGFNPAYLATVAKIVREFHKGEDWSGAVTLTMPNGRKPRRNGNGPEAKAALFVEAKRSDGRKLTVLLMPIRL